MKKSKQGFTLIELLIVIAIIGAISAIAYPAYTEHVKKGRRTIAQSELMSLTSLMEQYYIQNNSSYSGVGNVNSAPSIYPATIKINGTAMYNIKLTAISAAAYTLRITPISGTPQASDGWMQIDSVGNKAWLKDNTQVNYWD